MLLDDFNLNMMNQNEFYSGKLKNLIKNMDYIS